MPKRSPLYKLRGRTQLVWIWAAAVVSFCIFLSAVWTPLATYVGERRPPMPEPAELEVPSTPSKRAYLRVGSISTEGLGVRVPRAVLFSPTITVDGFCFTFFQSTLHHFKHSIVLATALDSSLIFSWDVIFDAKFEIDVYSTSRIWNGEESPIGNRAPSLSIDARKACRISDYVPSEDRSALVRGICSGEESVTSQMEKIKLDMQDCTSILDTEINEVIPLFLVYPYSHRTVLPVAQPRPQRLHHGLVT